MPIIQLPIANGSYISDSLPISAQECVNWYPNIVQTQALSQETLFGTPGLNQVAISSELETNRGGHEMAGVPYFVNGNKLYKMVETITDDVATYTLTALGTVAGTGRVSMADNGTQLMVLVPGGNGYIYNHSTDTFAQITDSDFTANGNPQYVVFIDGYFCCTTDSKKFIVSALNDGLSYSALDFGSAESDPDDIVAPIVFKNQLFIAGSQTIEAFQNIGGADFPFQRTGLFLSKGVSAPFSPINTQDTFVFIGGGANESPAIWSLNGNTVQKISTTAIDSILQDLTADQLSTIYAWSYAQKGAYFVGFSLYNTCLVYDLISGRWHERKSRVQSEQSVYRVASMVQAYNKVFCGDINDGRIGHLDPDVYTEYGSNIVRTVVTQPFQNNMQRFTVPMIELTVGSGVGNTDATDPVMTMERSVDGKRWSASRQRAMGKIGEYNRRCIWRRNGSASRFEMFRFTLSDPVKPVIIQLTADLVG